MMTLPSDFWLHIALLFYWVVYAMIEGRQEAHLYHYRNIVSPIKKKNLHWMPFVERGLFWLLIGYCNYSPEGIFPIVKNGLFMAGLVLMFPFFYDGEYYCMREKLKPGTYVKKWWSSSNGSEASLEFNCISRILMAFTGIMGVIASMEL